MPLEHYQRPVEPINLTIEELEADLLRERVIEDFHKRITFEWEEKLKAFLRRNLGQLGYVFKSDPEFVAFCAKRVKRAAFADKPNYYEFFLDHSSQENPGKFIGCCDSSMRFIYEGEGKITAIIGQ